MNRIQFNNSRGEKLTGILNIPTKGRNMSADIFPSKNGKGLHPTIILAHGFGYHMHENNDNDVPMFDEIARILCENGFVTLQFDFTGCDESEGDFSKTTLTTHISDLNSALEILKKLSFVDVKRIGIIGMSFGTAVTVAFMGRNRSADLFPSEVDHGIKAIVLLSSCKNPKEQIAKIFKDKGEFNPDGMSRLKHEDSKEVFMGPQFWKDFDNYKFPEIIKNIHVPLMMVHGEKDDLVGRKIDDYFDLANKPKELHIIKDTQHGFEGKEAMEEMLRFVLGWFKKWL